MKTAGNRKRFGYTLVELLMVVAIIIFLAVMTAPALAPLLRNRSLRDGGARMKAALYRARALSIANSTYVVPISPVRLYSEPEQWVIPTRMRVLADDWVPGDTTNFTANWLTGGLSGWCHTHSTNPSGVELVYSFDSADTQGMEIMVSAGDMIGVTAYVQDANVDGVGFTVETDGSWVATAYWGTGITAEGTGVDKGNIPATGKWIQLFATVQELGIDDGDEVEGIKLRSKGTTTTWFDQAMVAKDVFKLPQFIVPDMSQFPIVFGNDGSIRGGGPQGSQWFDRMIILKDVRDRELKQYLTDYDVADGNSNGFWECESFVDADDNLWFDGGESYDDFGYDRVKGTSDTGDTSSSWSYEGSGAGSPPTEIPSGQIYIKVNKITGNTKVCVHPGG